MLTQFSPLSVELIEEGRFLAAVNDDLRKAQASIVQHVKKYGPLAKKSKAVVKITVALICTDPENDGYATKATTSLTVPGRPPSVSLAIGGEMDDEQNVLFVRRSGSGKDSPRQRVLTTEDGREVDPEMGEVLEESSAED